MKKIIVPVIAIALLWSCNKTSNSTPVDCSTVTATYSGNIKAVVASKCAISGCHVAGSHDGDFTTYAGLYAKYSSGALKNEVVTKKSMPQGGSLTSTEYQDFACWIDAGAKNN